MAEALAAKGHEVLVKQHCRTVSNGRYAPFGDASMPSPTHVVVMRAPGALYQARKQFPNAKLYVWCHDIFGAGWVEGFKALVDTQAVPIVVSNWHQHQMYDAIRQLGLSYVIPCRRIYNPIDNNLDLDATPVDTNKLVFFSSPHKGLARTLEVFERFRDFSELKDMKLYIANPGYFSDHDTKGLHNVVNLGPLPHSAVVDHVRSALCVLHLNHVFPETFGIVHAEANAVGTPFLTSELGSTRELVDHPAELVDVLDNKKVIDRIIEWRGGRPRVRANPWFRLKQIIKEWENLLAL